jgi:hypothetical protein
MAYHLRIWYIIVNFLKFPISDSDVASHSRIPHWNLSYMGSFYVSYIWKVSIIWKVSNTGKCAVI